MSEILIINDQSVSLIDDEQMQKLEEELQAKVLIRTIDDENDSDYEDVDDNEEILIRKKDDDDNQNVPKEKLVEKNQELLDDDNNTQSPAYVPRKGKFYEHDDRTFDDNHRTKSENKSRFNRDFDGKWQHDLYFQDQKQTKSRQSNNQFHLNDYMSRSNHRQIPRDGNNNRMTNFQFRDQPIKSSKDNFPSKSHRINRDFEKYELKNNLPPRLQHNTNQRNSFVNLQSKRYSTMRNNSNQQQSNSNAKEQNEWPQAPPLPTTSPFLSQQLITPQMFYQQQTSRYVPLISDQFRTSK